MADKKFTITLNDSQQAGLQHAVDVANEQVAIDNEAIERSNSATADDTEVKDLKDEYTLESYLQFVGGTWADSYAKQAVSKTAVDLTAKLADMPTAKRQQIEALLAAP